MLNEFNDENKVHDHKGFGIRATNSGLYKIVLNTGGGGQIPSVLDEGLYTAMDRAQRHIDDYLNQQAATKEASTRKKKEA